MLIYNSFIFFGPKIAVYLHLGLHKGRTSYRRSLQPSKENIARIFKRLWSPAIDSKEWIRPAYVALAGRYDNPIPTRFLAPIDSSSALQNISLIFSIFVGHFCPPESGSGSSNSKRIRILLESASSAGRAAPAFSSAASSTAESGRRAVAMTRVPAVFRNPRTRPSPIPRDAPVIRTVRIAARINMTERWRKRTDGSDESTLIYYSLFILWRKC